MSASSTRVASRWRRTARRLRPPFVASSTGRFPWSNTCQTKENDMNQIEKAKRFAELHVKGAPLFLYNASDAGSAKAILEAGAKAIATSSWSVAEAQGYRDGEAIPVELVEQIVARIAATIDDPV